MPRQTSKLTDRAWAELFARGLSQDKVRRPVGKGWKTSRQLADMHDKSVQQTYRILRDAIKHGRVEMFDGMDLAKDGVSHRQVWYRPKAKAAQ